MLWGIYYIKYIKVYDELLEKCADVVRGCYKAISHFQRMPLITRGTADYANNFSVGSKTYLHQKMKGTWLTRIAVFKFLFLYRHFLSNEVHYTLTHKTAYCFRSNS